VELHQLRYFNAVARAGSFTRAAEDLGIAQPSLSQQIRALEKHLGAALFERLGRSVRLTTLGEALRTPALSILHQVTMAENALASLRDGVQGSVRIGVIPTILPYWFAPRVAQCRQALPDVELQLVEDSTPRLVEQLQSGELDVTVAGLPVRNRDIVCSELFREPMFLAVAKGHPLAGQAEVDVRACLEEPLLLLKEGHCLRDNVLMACTRARAELRSIFESNQLESIFELVRSGFGITLVPEMASSHCSGCALIPLKEAPVRRVGYLRARRHVLTRPVREFIAWLRSSSKSPTVRAKSA
jgi:LysR family hydrogen peroxide-inducible transcriptional activator